MDRIDDAVESMIDVIVQNAEDFISIRIQVFGPLRIARNLSLGYVGAPSTSMMSLSSRQRKSTK